MFNKIDIHIHYVFLLYHAGVQNLHTNVLGDYKSECMVRCFGLGSFLCAFGLVDAFKIGLSASIGGLGNL